MTLQSNTVPVEQVLLPAVRDLGDFAVRRALPSPLRRMVGPFIFLDSFGPTVIRAGQGIDTRPHPHIGLATVTYLIDGEMVHRDSEGYVQTIRPGEVNLMTAGRGIVHSERSGSEWRADGGTMFGFQAWLALPLALEETDPGFQHIDATALPRLSDAGVDARLLAGSLGGAHSPTRIFSETLYADVSLAAGARFKVESDHIERAAYVVEGEIEISGQSGHFLKDQLVIFRPGSEIIVHARGATRLMLLGGEPLEGKRHIFWNFVSSRKERIEQAADDWRARRFPGVPGDSEFIPLAEVPRAA
ncbi:pirin family protein [Mesorhizobium escarrei]|uniref:Pirin-like protein CC_3178 n=1 Tax=Mesorhizobium escarrei TaxID=666018 RepID=A0ABM9E4V5_9HYPH|nr:pirin family protein [Mesorhizobium escarrei]CAH2404147.1 Pirin-like protein CC_3178 [Mesorhizobium escarrei]